MTSSATPLSNAPEEATSVENRDVSLQVALHYLDVLDECNRQLKIIADDVLDKSRIAIGKYQLHPEVFPLSRLVNTVRMMFSAAAELRKITLVIQMSQSDMFIFADFSRLTQVLANLISNSVKFTPEKGTIRLSVCLEESSAPQQGTLMCIT